MRLANATKLHRKSGGVGHPAAEADMQKCDGGRFAPSFSSHVRFGER